MSNLPRLQRPPLPRRRLQLLRRRRLNLQHRRRRPQRARMPQLKVQLQLRQSPLLSRLRPEKMKRKSLGPRKS